MNKVSKKINGHDYEILSFPAIHNTKLFLKFSSVVGDSLKSIFSVADNNGFSGLGEGISLVLKSLHANDSNCDLILELLSQTTRDGKAINRTTFDMFYTGNIEEMMEALTESIIVHFKGFLPIDRLSGVLSTIGNKTTENSEI